MPKTCPVCSTTYPDTDAFCPKDGSTLRLDEGSASLVGSVIADRYLVSRLLGEGGMGQVYLAGHVRLPQQAAIKVLHASMVQDSGAIARFNREAANAARIEHERVARVFDFGETKDGLVYLAMEFVPGRTLRELLEESGRLEPTRAANILYQVAEGLDAAHRINIVHRDLKPDNVLVMTDEQGLDKCKVVDFGIAKALNDSDSKKTQLTQVGAIIGTPEYMSPEQVLGEAIDARSDVYALAVVAFHLLTGALPFSASTPERTLTARLIGKPLTLREAAPEIDWPTSLQTAFNEALEGDPAERTPTALIFAETLVSAVETWTGTGVLRGRTPLSMNVVPTPSVARLVSEAAAEHTLRKAQTVVAPAPASAIAAAAKSAQAAPATVAAPAQTATTTPAKRSPVALIGGLVAVAAVVAVLVLKGRGEEASSADAPATTLAAESPAQATPAEGTTGGDTRIGTGAPTPSPTGNGAAATAPAATSSMTPAPVAPTGAAAPVAPPTEGAADAAAAAAAAVRTLDSIANVINAPSSQPDALAPIAIPKLTALLPRLTRANDSSKVYGHLAVLHGSTDNLIAACNAVRAMDRTARADNQLMLVAATKALEYFKQCP